MKVFGERHWHLVAFQRNIWNLKDIEYAVQRIFCYIVSSFYFWGGVGGGVSDSESALILRTRNMWKILNRTHFWKCVTWHTFQLKCNVRRRRSREQVLCITVYWVLEIDPLQLMSVHNQPVTKTHGTQSTK